MESWIYNAQILGRDDAFAIRKLTASIACTPRVVAPPATRRIIRESDRVRAVLPPNERIHRSALVIATPAGCGRPAGSSRSLLSWSITTRFPRRSRSAAFRRWSNSCRVGDARVADGVPLPRAPRANCRSVEAPAFRGGFRHAPEKTRTSTDQSVHKALNLARLPIPPQARGRRV